MDLGIGTVAAGYEIQEPLGRGGQSQVYKQYCSFRDPDTRRDCDALGSLGGTGAQGEVAHLAFDAAGDPAVAAGYDPLLENLGEDGVMKCRSLLRGE